MDKEQKNPILKILLLDIGEFAGGAVVAVIIFAVLFGVLNYFNIISLSSLLPQLSFLPRQQTQANLQTNSALQNSVPKVSPTPTPLPEYIKNDTKSLISDILISSLVPNNLAVEKQNVENPNNFTFYGTGWETASKNVFVLSVEYNQERNIIDRQIVVHIPRILINLDASMSSSLIRDYIKISPPFPFSCISLPTVTKSAFCEVFWEDASGVRKGIDITSPVQGLQETQLLYCEHHKGTPAYSWKSCSLNYKDNGVTSLTKEDNL